MQKPTQKPRKKSSTSSSKKASLPKPHVPSSLERKFDLLWASVNGPSLEIEFKFHPVRRWRADYCHHASKTLIEIEGGAWGGRHSRGGGFLADGEKYWEATKLGWKVIRWTAPLITQENCLVLKQMLTK
jgi:very-short-patch-repair endonuclease